jgi:hypothetical protein
MGPLATQKRRSPGLPEVPTFQKADGVKCGHGCIDCVDLIEMKAQQEAMVFRHARDHRPAECR